jgi:20S proteasome subunit beta 6
MRCFFHFGNSSFSFFLITGKGAVYSYDAIGSYKRDDYGAQGSGQKFVVPILDNLIGHKNRHDEKKKISCEEAVAIMKDTFVVCAERDIYTGDSVEIRIIRKSGSTIETFQLKKD